MTDGNFLNFAGIFITALGALATGIYSVYRSSRKTDADAMQIVTHSALDLLKVSKEENQELRLERKELRRVVTELTAQIYNLGATPVTFINNGIKQEIIDKEQTDGN